MYLSSIQQGIQSAHVTHSLFVKYQTPEESPILWDWATNDKTMIVLNGGAGPDIKGAFEAIQHLNVEYDGERLPYQCFYEDASLDGMMTSFGVVVPQCFFDAKQIKNGRDEEDFAYYYDEQLETAENGAFTNRIVYYPNTAEHFFIGILKSCGLAR
jgi:hypothetical protein